MRVHVIAVIVASDSHIITHTLSFSLAGISERKESKSSASAAAATRERDF